MSFQCYTDQEIKSKLALIEYLQSFYSLFDNIFSGKINTIFNDQKLIINALKNFIKCSSLSCSQIQTHSYNTSISC